MFKFYPLKQSSISFNTNTITFQTRDTMRAQHSTGVVNAASQNTSPQDDEEDSPAVQNTSTTRTRHTSSRITQEDTGVDDIVSVYNFIGFYLFEVQDSLTFYYLYT